MVNSVRGSGPWSEQQQSPTTLHMLHISITLKMQHTWGPVPMQFKLYLPDCSSLMLQWHKQKHCQNIWVLNTAWG